MTPATTPPVNSAARASRFARALPVAEIFEVKHTEHIGLEAVVTVVCGDADHTPHTHGLRAPLGRWAQIFAGLANDPIYGERFLELTQRARTLAAARPSVPSFGDVRMPASTPLDTPAPEIPPRADPDNAFYR